MDTFHPFWTLFHKQSFQPFCALKRRTNNNLEGWHLRLNRAIEKTHANIYEFISKLIREQGSTETLLFQIEAGNIKRHSNSTKYKQINERIDIITREYNMWYKNVDEFLLGIAHNFSQPTGISL